MNENLNDMLDAYKRSSYLMKTKLAKDGGDLILREIKADDVLVVKGSYDHAEYVLEAAGTPHTVLSSAELKERALDPRQVVIVNCAGTCLADNLEGGLNLQLREFVERGGYLITSDWALKELIEPVFPNRIKYNGISTSDDQVEVDQVNSKKIYTRGLENPELKPIWWLERSSYPIEIIDKEGVEVLLASSEMEDKYQSSPIAVKFNYGLGKVFHVTSHFYLQKSDPKYSYQAKSGGGLAGILGLQESAINDLGLDSVDFGKLESAYTSILFLHNILLQKQRDCMGQLSLKSPKAKFSVMKTKKSKGTKPSKGLMD